MSGMALILSIVALLLSLVALARAGRVKKVAVPIAQVPDLQCGCNHELAMHDPETNRCHEMGRVHDGYHAENGKSKYKDVQCGCRQYTGDKPVDSFYSPRIIT